MRPRHFVGLFALILFAAGVWAGWRAWRGWRETHGPQFADTAIGGTRLRVHAAYLRPGATPGPSADRVDLVLRFPDFAPAGAAPPRDPAAFFVLALQASDRSVDPSERMEKLYGRFLERDVWTHPGGLFMRRFENASPYEREDLYFAPPEGRRFAARCVRPAQPPDGLPNMCVSEFRQRGLDAQIRFSPDLLPDWERLHEGSRALIEQMAR
jgi:hypothetical protein